MGTGTALAVDPDVVTCTLAPCYEAVKTARDFARTTLQRWGLGDLFDDVALVTSELVTNALRHAIGQQSDADPAARPASGDGGAGRLAFPPNPAPARAWTDCPSGSAWCTARRSWSARSATPAVRVR